MTHSTVRYGPQGEHVQALIERCERLTADELDALSVARDVAWELAASDDAGEAAWDAAWDDDARYRYAAWSGRAAWDAAWSGRAAWDAARPATRYVARYAALALVVRDLIGQHGFTQEHYDTLTGPWRTVIGPVHPDDAPMEQT